MWKMEYAYLIGGLIALSLSFIVHRFFIQFIVLSVFLIVLYVIEKNSCDVVALKKSIDEHNDLVRQDIELLKKKE